MYSMDFQGDEFLVYLRNYLPSIQFVPHEIEEYVFALQGSLKDFKLHLKVNLSLRLSFNA